ncbi:DUF6527 family protein [Neorhizobium galegae]|uniref:DUF6527 family protein n=1 Tax=Neorhizobium galegae TaxID=399 RepID=UPI001F439905|nr:DUF6527 family protein [Neorhizobium galegae]UIK04772.1 hypothetical protein LZK81_19225 [Neorhizobium galegae]
MTRIDQIRPEFVEFIPEDLSSGVLYVSKRYSTASHLCCCGCGLEVVTPLNPAKWRLVESGHSASLSPSVGNWSFPCRSHYWITGNQVRWAAAMSAKKIAAVKARDRRDVEVMVPPPRGLIARFIDAVAAKIAGRFRG